MIARRRTYVIGAVLAVAFFGIFSAAGGFERGPSGPTPTPTMEVKGNSGQYLYSITSLPGQNKKLAQFDPSLPAEDGVVVETLRAVAKDSYGLVIGADVQPVVETVDETNYVTLTTGKDKLLFELFRNSSGQVGTARFWRETVSN